LPGNITKKNEKYKEKTQATDSGDVAVSDSFHYLSTRAFRVLFRTGSVWKVRGRSSRSVEGEVTRKSANALVLQMGEMREGLFMSFAGEEVKGKINKEPVS